jgi:8-oxo-dGTP diphosphatase
MTRHIIALVFRCKVIGGHLAETSEAGAFRWVTADEVRSLANRAFGIRVLDAMQDNQVPAIRHHDGVRLYETAKHTE